jgi:hypothetical protein
MSITFETKVWEDDWEIMLKTTRIQDMIERCGYDFDEKILYINNVKDIAIVELAAKNLLNKGVITQYVKVADYAQAALTFFALTPEKLGKGYYYSIAELVSIYLCKTKYLLHFSSDSIIASRTKKGWLQIGIQTLEKNPQVKIFNLTWNNKYKDAKKDSDFIDENNFYSFGFSDQMYLIRSEDFKLPIYEHYHPASENYPAYGGELFEKRVYSWLREKNFIRATYRYGSYLHQNFPKAAWKKSLSVRLNAPNLFKK